VSERLSGGRDAPVGTWYRRAIIAPALIVSFVTGASASDADLQRALLEARCVKAEIKPLPREGKASIDEANCLGSSHKVIEVVCVDGHCMVSPSSHRSDEISG
jgi:hypothetical protein